MAWDRRRFLTALGGATLAWPRAVEALAVRLDGGGSPDDEAFWAEVRTSFSIPDDRIYLNNGTLGPSPSVVVDAVIEHTRRVASTYPPGIAWDDVKAGMAALVGGDPEGFVFPRNTTEAMNFVAHGLDFLPDDRVVTTDHEHIGGLEAWRLLSSRRRVHLDVAHLPTPLDDPREALERIWDAVTPATRVVAVSHMTFTTGALLPIGQLAERCQRQGIVLVVDGAHPPGMLELDVARVGGSFYASSPHKWLLAPQGTGMLYIGREWRERLWPTLASGGWDDLSLGAHRFNHMGTMDESRMAGLLAATEFMSAIGMERIEGRVRHLRARIEEGLRGIDRVSVVTPAEEANKGAMVAFSVEGVESLELQRHLSRAAKIRTRVIGEYDYGWMRLSTHMYNSPAEIDRVLELIDDAARNGIPA